MYDEKLANRIRETLIDQKYVEEKKMMGGLTFMVNDKMCVGIMHDDLMIRIDPNNYEKLVEVEGVRVMDFTGRPMKGFLLISPEVIRTNSELNYWMKLALEYNKHAKTSAKRK